jgi:hypothetical protein
MLELSMHPDRAGRAHQRELSRPSNADKGLVSEVPLVIDHHRHTSPSMQEDAWPVIDINVDASCLCFVCTPTPDYRTRWQRANLSF